MPDIAAVLFVALYLIDYAQLVCLGLLIIALVYGIQGNQKKLVATSISFFLSAILVIGIPMGIIKTLYPEMVAEQNTIIKEVKSWIH